MSHVIASSAEVANLQNFPVLTAVSGNATAATAAGKLNSTPNRAFRVELFHSTISNRDVLNGSGFGRFLAAGQVMTDANGNATFSIPITGLLPGEFLTATATDLSTNDTSACSEPFYAPLDGTPGTRGQPAYVVAADQGAPPRVKVYNTDGSIRFSFLAYDAAFRGGVHVARADLNGDNIADIVTVPGPGGGPHVKIYDGRNGHLIREFMAYDPNFRGGVSISAGNRDAFDSNQPQLPIIVTGAGPGGGPHVIVFDAVTGSLVTQFMAYDPSFRGGVNVAAVYAGDGYSTNSDNRALSEAYKVATIPASGGGPHLKYFFAGSGNFNREIAAYDPGFRGGINIAGQGGYGILGPNVGGGPDARDLHHFNLQGNQLASWIAPYDPSSRRGLRVGMGDYAFGVTPVYLATGPGMPPELKAYDIELRTLLFDIHFADPEFQGGIWIA